MWNCHQDSCKCCRGNSFGTIPGWFREGNYTSSQRCSGTYSLSLNGVLFAELQEYRNIRATSKVPGDKELQENYNSAHCLPGKCQTDLSNRKRQRTRPGQCIQLAILAKPQPKANGNVDKILYVQIQLEVGCNKELADGRPGALRCYLTHVPAGRCFCWPSIISKPSSTEQEEREIIMSYNDDEHWHQFRGWRMVFVSTPIVLSWLPIWLSQIKTWQ